MPTRGYYGKCPPGVFCVTPGYVLLITLLILGIGVALYVFVKPITVQLQSPEQPVIQSSPVAIQVAASQGGDDRYTRAPKPERHWITTPEIPTYAEMYGKLPSIPTQGIPETYQSMGVITMEDGQVLPLYGRRTASRSDRFQYYTRTDTYNPVQLPIKYNRRDCQDTVGCEELFDRENVTIAPTNKTGTVSIYRFDGPTYIPGIL